MRGLAAEADGDVGADGLEALLLVVAEADAEAHQQDDRGDAPDDAEHGEEAAELVLPQRGEGLFEDLEKRHRCLSLLIGITRLYAESSMIGS